MARYSVAARMTNAPTATLPGATLYASASIAPKIREIGVFNTTTTACMINVVYFTGAGTVGAGLTETKFDNDTATATATAYQSSTSTPPTLGNEIVRASLGAAVGAGMVWTFDAEPIRIPIATTNGIGFLCLTGTGQICDFYIIWDE